MAYARNRTKRALVGTLSHWYTIPLLLVLPLNNLKRLLWNKFTLIFALLDRKELIIFNNEVARLYNISSTCNQMTFNVCTMCLFRIGPPTFSPWGRSGPRCNPIPPQYLQKMIVCIPTVKFCFDKVLMSIAYVAALVIC